MDPSRAQFSPGLDSAFRTASDAGVRGHRKLPLAILVMILSHIDEPRDIASVARTSRWLYCMTLPKLWENVALRSYRSVHRTDERIQAVGDGSPFLMGLNALLTTSAANLVRRLSLSGEWGLSDADDFPQGKIPDGSMILHVTIGAALHRLAALEAFTWKLDLKPLEPIYRALQMSSTLRSLTIKFPSTRAPKPVMVVPPLPHLAEFEAVGIDPLCYPDDISTLLSESKCLTSLHLHWSPRMRAAAEESINLHSYFGRCIAVCRPLQLTHFSLVNLYTRGTTHFESLVDVEGLQRLTIINCIASCGSTLFIDDEWQSMAPQRTPRRLKMLRSDILDPKKLHSLKGATQLERLYIVSKLPPPSSTVTPESIINYAAAAPEGNTASPSNTSRIAYMSVITQHVGVNLRHLLLSDQWLLDSEMLMKLATACPLLEQLGLALEEDRLKNMRMPLQYLSQLWALRILVSPERTDRDLMCKIPDELATQIVGSELAHTAWANIRWLGYGDRVFLCGRTDTVVGMDGTSRAGNEPRVKRAITRVQQKAVQDVEIWSMDTTDV